MSIQPSKPAPSKPVGTRRKTGRQGRSSTRARLLASAERLFAERGYANVTMPMIAEASGVTAGAIYKHFEGKAALFFEVVRGVVQSTAISRLDGGFEVATDLPVAVANYTTRRSKQLRQLAVEVHSAAAKDPAVRRFLRRSLDLQMGQMRDSIGAGQQAGELDPDLAPDLLAGAVFVFVMGLVHMETLLPHLVGDETWRKFVAGRVAQMLGVSEGGQGPPAA